LLGNVWWVVDPLLQMAVYYILIAVILQRDRYTADTRAVRVLRRSCPGSGSNPRSARGHGGDKPGAG